MKYCMRRSNVYQNGGCCIWRLKDDGTYVDACAAWPDYRHGVYRLCKKTELGGWMTVAKVAMQIVNVPISQVKGLSSGQITAIEKDIKDGRISRYA